MSIDETSLSNGEIYTFLSNKDAHCKKGSIAAYVKGTKSDDIVKTSCVSLKKCVRRC